MRKFEKKIDDRKLLVARLSQLTGLDARYTFVPRCAYEIGAFTVEKDGVLTVEEGADENILDTLIAENLIGEERLEEQATRPSDADVPALGTEEWEDDEWGGTDAAEEQDIWHPDSDFFPETQDFADGASNTLPGNASGQENLEEPVGSIEPNNALEASISFPLSKHTPTSIINLICTLYSRGPLLSKATGGTFYAGKALVNELLDHPPFLTTKEIVGFLREKADPGQLKGLTFEEGKITLDGFGIVGDPEHLQTFMKLATAINKMALTQKRVQAKDVDDTNEKYALRIWLIRLGMNGNDCKADRKRLMANLSGHTAFRNETEKARWTAKQTAKRDALKAAKEAH